MRVINLPNLEGQRGWKEESHYEMETLQRGKEEVTETLRFR